jgi:hypothetical protein
MKRKSLIEAVSPARDFTGAGTPKPQSVLTQPEKADGKASPALVPETPKTELYPAEKREMPASVLQQSAAKIPSSLLVPQTFRLPQRLIEDLARAGELQALSWLDREGNTWLPIISKSTLP